MLFYIFKRHIGFGIWMTESAYQSVLNEASTGNGRPVKFIKALALKVLGLKVLATTSVSGTPSRCKDRSTADPVKPKCLVKVKDILLMNVLQGTIIIFLIFFML